MVIFFNLSSTTKHLHQLQVENCDSNSRLVVDDDDNGEFRIERVKAINYLCVTDIKVCFDLQSTLKGLAHAKIIKKSVILFRVLNMTI